MLETLVIMLQNVLDFSRQNNISIPKNIPSLLQEAINLLQELDYESLPFDEFLHGKKSDEDFTEPQNPINPLLL